LGSFGVFAPQPFPGSVSCVREFSVGWSFSRNFSLVSARERRLVSCCYAPLTRAGIPSSTFRAAAAGGGSWFPGSAPLDAAAVAGAGF